MFTVAPPNLSEENLLHSTVTLVVWTLLIHHVLITNASWWGIPGNAAIPTSSFNWSCWWCNTWVKGRRPVLYVSTVTSPHTHTSTICCYHGLLHNLEGRNNFISRITIDSELSRHAYGSHLVKNHSELLCYWSMTNINIATSQFNAILQQCNTDSCNCKTERGCTFSVRGKLWGPPFSIWITISCHFQQGLLRD